MMNPFNNKYFPIGFVEHIAGRRYLLLPVAGVKSRNEDKLDGNWQNCSDVHQAEEPNSSDKLSVSWRQHNWNCRLVLDRRHKDGIWSIEHVESGRYGSENFSAGIGINCSDKTWLWFYAQRQEAME